MTNEAFARFVKATHYLTLAERKPTAQELPEVPEQDRVAGSSVFNATKTAVSLDHPERVRRIPHDGALTLSLAPVLSLPAETSLACHERVRGFVHAQNRLLAELIERAVLRRNPSDRAETALLRRLLRTAEALGAQLERAPARERARSAEVAALEAWLGV